MPKQKPTFDMEAAIAALRDGPERQLLTRQDTTTAGTTSTVFVGGLYEKVTALSI